MVSVSTSTIIAVLLHFLTILSICHSQLLNDCVPTGEVCVIEVALNGGCCTGFCAVPPGQAEGICDVVVPVVVAASVATA
ncbi:unnamed protein product [Orchesella dallaii]|uniref:Uncharacterized protein n=1 Tax=Orchesella dallaii TaxID=48710 RepID=A0ABP1QNI9_9HEXA